MKPRCYQVEAVDTLWSALHNEHGNPLGIAPTGTGKTFIMNALAKRLMSKYKSLRILSVTHDKTIIGQNANAMRKFWRSADVGVYSAGMKMRDTRNRMIFAGIQSVHRKAKEFRSVSVLFIDEAHMLSPNDGTMYQRFVTDLLEMNPKMKIVMLSATPYRLGQGHLLESDMADYIAFDYTETEKFMWFVDQGYLSRLITKKSVKEIDISEARVLAGEFNEKDIQRLSNTRENNIALVQECLKFGLDRDHWMVFASGIEHGAALAEQFEAHGIAAIALHASSENREQELAKWEQGGYRALINVGLYTTGYDFPALDLIAVARATQSTSLWVQMCGRGTRPLYGEGEYDLDTQEGRLAAIKSSKKQNCLVLDFAGNTRRLGAINCPVIPKPRRKGDANEGDAPVKVCPECDTYNHTRAARCMCCGYEFPPPKEVVSEASTDDVMVDDAMEPRVEELAVLDTLYKRGKSRDSQQAYFRVSYTTFNGTFAQYFHPGSSYTVACDRFNAWWWHCLAEPSGKKGAYDYPDNIADALDRAPDELKDVTTISVDFNSKYNEVIGVNCDPQADEEEPF
jgi:DNA repair protein RadD|tara:strand:+ start:2392 stop:4098 length:1707 start_codon:yes stop_codon:yes gene_type:complete